MNAENVTVEKHIPMFRYSCFISGICHHRKHPAIFPETIINARLLSELFNMQWRYTAQYLNES